MHIGPLCSTGVFSSLLQQQIFSQSQKAELQSMLYKDIYYRDDSNQESPYWEVRTRASHMAGKTDNKILIGC